MLAYQQSTSCLLEQLRLELDDPLAAQCGRCGNCRGQRLPFEIDPEVVVAATEFLNRTDVAIRPRLRWPLGYEGPSMKTARLAEGRALAVWGDPGLARLVRDGKQHTHRFDDRLVSALADLIEKWSPKPAPDWLTWVPAFQGGGIVADFTERLGLRLGLPVQDLVIKVAENRPQEEMQNSFHQARNVQRAFAISGEVSGHGLLIDDIVDSRWTLTVIGSLLRDAGAETVYPVVLADASRGG